jgi:hypothetical protein
MSSNNPYGAQWADGGPPPPMAGHAPSPGQQPSPYGYPQPQRSPAGYPQPPVVDGSDATSRYAFGPFAPDQQQTGGDGGPQPRPYGRPNDRYSRDRYSPGRLQPTPPLKSKSKTWIIVGAAALAVILMAVIAVVVATRDRSEAQGGTGGQQTNSSQSGASRPSDAVAAYLQALAAGDATTALSYAADPAPTGPLLTNEVLAASLERAPVTGIDVPVVEDQSAKSVSATYTLGDSAVSETFDVAKVGDVWKISRAVKDLDISFIVDGSVPLKINGVKVSEDSVAVLPGSYAFTSGLRYVGYGSKNVLLVKSPYVEADTYQIQSELTKAGKKAVISATEKSFNSCLKERSLSPSNCPQKFDSKYKYDKSTITWQQNGDDPFRKPAVSFSGTQARIEIPINLKLSGSCAYQGRSGNCSGTLTGKSVAVVKVMSKPIKVRWL